MQYLPHSAASLRRLLVPVLAISMTVTVAMLLVAWAGAPIADTFVLMLAGGFGSKFALTETLTRATPLILTGLAAAVAFRTRLFNIGAEGQLYLGALAGVAMMSFCSSYLPAIPSSLVWVAMVLASVFAGAALLLASAALKTRYGVDEVVTTLLMNFVVLLFVSAMLDGVMKDPTAMGWPQSQALSAELELTRLIEKTRLHSGLVWALLLALVVALVTRYTAFGFEMRMVGASARAARFQGLPVGRVMLKTAALSGGLAGLAGLFEVAGRTGYLTLDMSPGYGYTGIVIAMLAASSPFGVVLAAILVAGVLVGADSMSRIVNVPTYIADAIVATAMLSILVARAVTRTSARS